MSKDDLVDFVGFQAGPLQNSLDDRGPQLRCRDVFQPAPEIPDGRPYRTHCRTGFGVDGLEHDAGDERTERYRQAKRVHQRRRAEPRRAGAEHEAYGQLAAEGYLAVRAGAAVKLGCDVMQYRTTFASPQLRAISLAFEDHGDTVPKRGSTNRSVPRASADAAVP